MPLAVACNLLNTDAVREYNLKDTEYFKNLLFIDAMKL